MTADRHNLFHSIANFVARRRAARAAIRTERIVGGLPRQIRKDIGWPDLWIDIDRNRR